MKKNTDSYTTKARYKELKTTAKEIGKTRRKVESKARQLKATAKKKVGVKAKVVKTAKELKITAGEIGKTKVEVEKTAGKLKATTKEKEKTIVKLRKSATRKERVRFRLAEVAKQLAATAKDKEETRIKLEKTVAIIKELSDRNEAILSSIGEAALACDKKGQILLFNKMAEEITGISKKEAIGTHLSKIVNFINEKTGKPTVDFISEAINQKKRTTMEAGTLLFRRDGVKIPVADSAAPIFDSKGDVTGCIVVFRDVSKERSIDRAKTELVSLSSHQLRSPLTAIGWYLELLQSKSNGTLTAKQLKLTKEIKDAYDRMTTLINSLLNVSRIDMGTFAVEPKPAKIIPILKETLELFKHQIIEKKLTLKENYSGNLDDFLVDSRIIEIIFQNLISNAVKYTPVHGSIDINVKNDKTLLISVKDTGIGIPKSQQSKIFSKLFRADNASNVDPGGTGLGLYIVYATVRASGGKVWFESKEGKGTTFYVSYPSSGMMAKKGDKRFT